LAAVVDDAEDAGDVEEPDDAAEVAVADEVADELADAAAPPELELLDPHAATDRAVAAASATLATRLMVMAFTFQRAVASREWLKLHGRRQAWIALRRRIWST
jgi:hypothetical protein